MITDKSEVSLSCIDEMNIPITSFLSEVAGKWEWRASNFMPRRGAIAAEQYFVVADTKEEIQKMLLEKVIPLFEAAIHNLKTDCENYYWERITS